MTRLSAQTELTCYDLIERWKRQSRDEVAFWPGFHDRAATARAFDSMYPEAWGGYDALAEPMVEPVDRWRMN